MKTTVFFVFLYCLCHMAAAKKTGKTVIQEISGHKEFKKLMKTKTNVLVYFFDKPISGKVINVLREVADKVKGTGTIVSVECGVGDGKKLCKKLKIKLSDKGYLLKHYKDGDFNKDYDRLETVESMTTFMKDPKGTVKLSGDILKEQEKAILAKEAELEDTRKQLKDLTEKFGHKETEVKDLEKEFHAKQMVLDAVNKQLELLLPILKKLVNGSRGSSLNSPRNLVLEATLVNHNFSQQVLKATMEEENKPLTTEDQSSSGEKMPPPPSRQEQATIERAEEQKLRAKYPQANKPTPPATGGGPAEEEQEAEEEEVDESSKKDEL